MLIFQPKGKIKYTFKILLEVDDEKNDYSRPRFSSKPCPPYPPSLLLRHTVFLAKE